MSNELFSDTLYYLHRSRESDCEVYTFYSEAGAARLVAEVRAIPKDIWFRKPERTGLPVLVLKAGRYFSVSGKYDVLEYEGGPRLGVLQRAGKFFDGADNLVGQIDDPTPMGARAKEGLVEAVADAFMSGGDGSTHYRGPDVLELHVGQLGRELGGAFRRCRLPFTLPGRGKNFAPTKFLQRFLPAGAQAALENIVEPHGWRLDFSMAATGKVEPRLRVAATLFRIELERMSGG
jgi:hypothetical protein